MLKLRFPFENRKRIVVRSFSIRINIVKSTYRYNFYDRSLRMRNFKRI